MIRVLQSHCNFSSLSANKSRPDWFNREKLFDSFIETLDHRVEYKALHDVGTGNIEDHFLHNKHVEKITHIGGNGAQAYLNILKYAIEQNYDDNDIIYFVEDDYIHRSGWIEILLEGFEYIDADYFTLYDHPNKYYPELIEQFPTHIFTTPSTHWRTTISTTNTYACKFKTLKKHYNIHTQYCDLKDKWVKDHDKFTHLWKVGSNLLSCMPGYSSHVEKDMLSPIIDWSKI